MADHAKRADERVSAVRRRTTTASNYGERGRDGVPADEQPREFRAAHGQRYSAPNDLTWYANIPVPTCYMCMGSQRGFSSAATITRREAGVVHVANHHIAPGKKQWTWGNHEFGYAWDRNLTDADGPYIELMAGVYTDNQPDFSFLQPGETKTWSQYWYPIHQIGPAQKANRERRASASSISAATCAWCLCDASISGARVRLEARGNNLAEWVRDLAPGKPFVENVELPSGINLADLTVGDCGRARAASYFATSAPSVGEPDAPTGRYRASPAAGDLEQRRAFCHRPAP